MNRLAIATILWLPASATAAVAAQHEAAVCAATIGGLCVDTTINVAVVVPIVIFALGYFINEWLKRRIAALDRMKLYKALLVEVRLNLKGLEKAAAAMPGADAFAQLLRADKNNRPVLVSHHTADVYKANVRGLVGLPVSLIDGIVTFYQTLEYLRCASAAIDLQAFSTISDAGREGLIEMIRDTVRSGHAQGEGVERQLEQILDGNR